MDDRKHLAWETVASRVAYRCPGFDVVHDDVRLPDGAETDYDYLSEPPAVVVLPFTTDGDVVLIEEWRQAVDRTNRSLPAGTMEGSEDPEAAARRELREETGYEADAVEWLTAAEPANGVSDTVHNYVRATGCTPTAEQDLDADETIRVTTAGWPGLHDAAVDGELRDGRALTAVLLHAARERERNA
jgi:ADP-ribose pyrophosphatase